MTAFFFDQKTLSYCEQKDIEYIIKAKMQKGIQKITAYVNEHPDQYPLTELNKTYSVTEITVPLPSPNLGLHYIASSCFILYHKSP